MEKHYSVQQVAEMLGVDDETVLSFIHARELEAVNLCKSRAGKRPTWRVGEVALGRFLIARRNANPEPAVKTVKRPPCKQYV